MGDACSLIAHARIDYSVAGFAASFACLLEEVGFTLDRSETRTICASASFQSSARLPRGLPESSSRVSGVEAGA